MEFYSHIKPYLAEVEDTIESRLQAEDERVYGILISFIRRGGKRIRPVLSLLSCGAVEGEYSKAVVPASLVELFHNFTLIHDDIEDDSHFRRGEPTLHIAHGIPMALNCSDALYTLLWNGLVNLDMEPSKLQQLQRLYASSFKRVVDGQGIELSWIKDKRFDVSEEEYLDMIKGKTSALTGLACEAGAFVGNNNGARKALRDYGEKVGTAFQIHDDVLNLTGDFEKYQKEIGGDISEGKRTLMVVHCLKNAKEADRKKLTSILSSHSKKKEDISAAISMLGSCGSIDYARKAASRLADEAKKHIAGLPPSRDKEALLALADYVVSRER